MYLSVADVKAYLGIAPTHTGDDALLTVLLEAATSAIERACDRQFAAAQATTRSFEAAQHASRTLLYLDAELAQLASITNGDGQPIALHHVLRLPDEPPALALLLRPEAGLVWRGTVQVGGYWGYSLSPPAAIVQATREYVAYLYRGYDQQVQQPERGDLHRLPAHIRELLAGYRRLR